MDRTLRGVRRPGGALLVVALLAACAPHPPPATNGIALGDDPTLERRVVASRTFSLVVFSKTACDAAPSGPVPVFLDGDGNSWLRGGRVPADPTPARPIALELLATDEACGVYVSRPCTFGLVATDPRCAPAVWTTGRYAEEVIADLAQAIDRSVAADRAILLVGYSGGGLLAGHVAARLERVRGLITLGANLDVEAWSAHHGFTAALPARTPPAPFPLRPEVAQLHVFGGRDATSPRALAARVLARDPRAGTLDLPGADHVCCWVRSWERIRDAHRRRAEDGARRMRLDAGRG